MATKIILDVEDGLSRQEMDDLRYLFADALGEFAATRNDAAEYVEGRYPGDDHAESRLVKVQQVLRRVRLARKLHNTALAFEFVHAMPHQPTAVIEYYKTCDEDDLAAMSAVLDFLPATQFGERKGWTVSRDQGILMLDGPDEQRAFWNEVAERWLWLEEASATEMVQ